MKKILTVLLALLLTGTILLFCSTLIASRMLAPSLDENGAPVDDRTVREEKELLRERIGALAELYGFSAGPVIDAVSEETLRDLNVQASRWWSSVLLDGRPGKEIEWDTGGVEKALAEDPSVAEGGAERLEELTVAVRGEIRGSVIRMVLPLRQQIIRLGLQKIGKRVNLPSLIRFFTEIPWAALALCALLAGLIALVHSRQFHTAVRYIGSAMGAAALVTVCLAVLYLLAGVYPMIREASASLTLQYGHFLTGALVRTGICAAVLAAACVLCLKLSRKGGAAA